MKNRQVRAKLIPNLEKTFEELKSELKNLCKACGLQDLTALEYHSLSVVETNVIRRGKAYKRIQLKAYYTKNGKLRSKTLKSFKPEEAPRQLQKIVLLYRGLRHFSKALDYLLWLLRNF